PGAAEDVAVRACVHLLRCARLELRPGDREGWALPGQPARVYLAVVVPVLRPGGIRRTHRNASRRRRCRWANSAPTIRRASDAEPGIAASGRRSSKLSRSVMDPN